MKYELIIFDCDGVLVDSEAITFPVFLEMLAQLGLHLSEREAFGHFAGRTLTDCRQIALKNFDIDFGDDFIPAFDERCYAQFRIELKVVTHVPALLELLPPHRWCIASSGPHEKMDITLDVTGLQTLAQGRIFSADDVARGKPHPDLFLHAAKSMGHCPSRCVVIEDSAPGVRAAVAAGMQVYGYAAHGQDEYLHAAGANRVINCMSALHSLLH